MATQSAKDVVASSIEALAQPFLTTDELKTLSMKLDAIAGALLRSPYVIGRIGADQASRFAQAGVELPRLLRAVGDEPFRAAAASADNLLTFGRASIVEYDLSEEDMAYANAARAQFHQDLASVAAAVDW